MDRHAARPLWRAGERRRAGTGVSVDEGGRLTPRCFVVAASFAALALAGCSASSDRILAVVAGEPITVHAYEQAALRTRSAIPSTDEQKREFLNRLIDFRLKVREAEERGLGRDPELLADSALYRNQLAVSWYLERKLFEPGMRRLYERRKEMIRLQEIEIRNRRFEDGSIDTAGTRTLAQSVLDQALAGRVPFDSLVLRYSDTETRNDDFGDVGWIIAGMGMPEVDDAVSHLAVGAVAPNLLRTRYGYYILRVLARGESRSRVRASQILYRLDTHNPSDTAAGFARLSLILDSLRRGLASFEDLAMRNSQDTSSGRRGGDMGWLDRGLYLEPTFERAVFSLKAGEVSHIIRTPFGLHLVKLTEDPPVVPYDSVKNELRTAFRNERFSAEYRALTEQLRAKYKFVISPDVRQLLIARTGAAITTSTPSWDARLTEQERDAYLFRLADRPFRIRDLRERSRIEPSLQMRPFTVESIDSMCILIANREVILLETATLEQTDPEFRQMLRDYQESSMVARLEFEELQKRVKVDDSEVRTYWAAHRSEFRWPDRVNISEIFVNAVKKAEMLIDSLKNGADFGALARRNTRRPGFWDKDGAWGWLPLDQNELTRRTAGQPAGAIVGPIPLENGASLVRVNAHEQAREQTYEEAYSEARGRLAEDLRHEALRRWMSELRAKYDVSAHPELLVDAFPNAAK